MLKYKVTVFVFFENRPSQYKRKKKKQVDYKEISNSKTEKPRATNNLSIYVNSIWQCYLENSGNFLNGQNFG